MVTEELLQFIREQRAAGTEQSTIDQFLTTEGGWDAADIAEALSTLDAPPSIPFVSSTPSFASAAPVSASYQEMPAPTTSTFPATSVFADQQPAAQRMGQPESPHTSTPFMTASSASLMDQTKDAEHKRGGTLGGLHDILSGAPREQMSAEPQLTHENFLGLFTKGATPSVEAPQVSSVAATSTPEVVVPLPTPVTPSSQPIKFNLSALRATASTPLSSGSQRVSIPVGGAASLSGRAPATPSGSLSSIALAGSVQGGGGVSAVSSGLAAQVGTKETEKIISKDEKKIPITGKRTMASDISSSSTGGGASLPISALPARTPSPRPAAVLPISHAFEMGGQQGGLANAPLEKHEQKSVASMEPLTVSAPPVTALAVSPFQDDVLHAKKMKRILLIAIGAFVAVLLLAGGVFAFMKLRTPDSKLLLSTAFSQFFAVHSFSYAGQVATDLALSATSAGLVENGTMKFLLKYDGQLANSKEGYGDGAHTISLAGGWQWADSLLSTDMRSDIRAVGNALYFHVLALPDKNDLDPEWFKNNWLKVDIADLANQLRISGVAPGSEGYGNFGGGGSETAFNTLLGKSLPLLPVGIPSQETIGDVSMTRIAVVADSALMADFVRALYQKYSHRSLALSEDQLVRFKGALAKVSGDVWVTTETGVLTKVMLAANFDDDIAGMRVVGPASIEFTFADFNKEVAVTAPTGALTLPDLNMQMAEFKELKEVRARDRVGIDRAALLIAALEEYQRDKGRYPKALTELYGAGKLATSSVSMSSLNTMLYRSYQQSALSTGAGVASKSAQCLTTGKVCAFYHLGVNLEDATNPALGSDADQTTAILGADSAGCSGETKLACYDVVGTLSTPAAHAAPSATTTPPR